MDGYLTVTANTTELQAACMIDNNGFTIGGEMTLIGVETTVGKTNGTYVGISAGLSEGFYIEGALGKAGQYGFSLDLPVFPIGIAIYVKGSDAASMWNAVSGWSVGASSSVASGMTLAWDVSVILVQHAIGNISIALAETYHSTEVDPREDR